VPPPSPGHDTSVGARDAKKYAVDKIGEKTLFRGSWLSLRNLTYRTAAGSRLEWEIIVRSREETVVVVLARLRPSGRYLLIRQFRPGVQARVIALPAGCVAPGRDIRLQAEAELKEETGYSGTIVSVSPRLKINPAVLDCDLYLVEMEVDETAPENLEPRQELEPEEEIEVFPVEPARIREFLRAQAAAGCEIASACWLIFETGPGPASAGG